MKLSGSTPVEVSRAELWRRLRDPAHVRRALPEGASFDEVEARSFAVVVTTGMAGTHGTYRGTVSVTEVQEPDRARLQVDVVGEPGTVRADVAVRLAEDGSGTLVSYDAEVVVTGLLAAVGRQVLAGSLTRVADEVLAALGDATPEPDAGSESGVGVEAAAGGEAAEVPLRPARHSWRLPAALATLAALVGALLRRRARRGGG